jgi:hypothetical protein
VTRQRSVAVLAFAAVALAAGCGADDDPAPSHSTRAQPTAAPASAPAPPPAQRVRFRAADGELVTARYTAAGEAAAAVVLLHEIHGGPGDWDRLIPYLHAAGFATLAYQSRPGMLEQERLPDALAAVRWLRARPDVDRRRLALVGASIGASTAVLAMATGARRTVDAAVALSPPDSADIFHLQDNDRYHPHDLLLVSDASESAAAEGMLSGAVRSRAIRSAAAGHGLALLSEPGVRNALLAWLDEHVRP